MKLLLNVFVLASLSVVVTYGWTAREQTDNTKDHPGYCYSETEDVGAMEKDEVKFSRTRCVKITCEDNGLIGFYGCGVILPPPGCSLSDEDLSKDYPECCPKPDVCNY